MGIQAAVLSGGGGGSNHLTLYFLSRVNREFGVVKSACCKYC